MSIRHSLFIMLFLLTGIAAAEGVQFNARSFHCESNGKVTQARIQDQAGPCGNMSRRSLNHAAWGGRNLAGIRLLRSKLKGAELAYADLRGADMQFTDLSNANLFHADLRHADLRRARLFNTDLRHADLRGARLRDVHYPGVRLEGATFNADTVLPFTRETAISMGMRYQD